IRRARQRRQRRLAVAAGTATVAAFALLVPLAFAGSPRPRAQASGPGPTPSTRTAPVASAAPTLIRCAIADLPVPDGLDALGVTLPPRVFVTAMDRTGAYIAASAFDARNDVAAVILWHDQVPTVLPTGGLGSIMTTAAVNSNGVVAGTGEAPGAVGFAWV